MASAVSADDAGGSVQAAFVKERQHTVYGRGGSECSERIGKGIWDLDVVNALMASFDLKDLDGIGE